MITLRTQIDDCTRLIALLGLPAASWPSVKVYNAVFESLGMNWLCVPLPTPGGQLREALLGLRALGFVGAELLSPLHQGEALKYVEELAPSAETIGAVKTIRVDELGRLVGDNLYWLGFLAVLRVFAPSLNGLRPLIVGVGWDAQSVVYALAREGLPLTIVDKQVERAVDLVHRLRHASNDHRFSVHRWSDLNVCDFNLIINASGVGADHTPWPDDLAFPVDALVFDLTFCPDETYFLRQARASGVQAVAGLSFLVCEATLAFERWTGQPCSFEVMWQAVSEVLPQDMLWFENKDRYAQICQVVEH